MPKPKKDKFILGISGNIACGKSTVAAMFKTKDALLIDADLLARRLLSKGTEVYLRVKKIFGREILGPGQKINRQGLGKIVFADKQVLNKLNRIMHPVLIRQIKQLIKSSGKRIVILDAALIIEAGLTKMVDKLIVVTAKKSQQILRAKKSSGLTKVQALQRLKSQISQKVKLRFADFIIDNSGSIEQTRKQVSAIRRTLVR